MRQNARDRIGTARTLLFVPANRLDRIPKAVASGADLAIVDLEDAVAPDDKESARAALSDWLTDTTSVGLLVRVNGRATPWHDDDLAVCRLEAVIGVVLPKAENAAEVEHVRQITGKPVIALIETGASVDAVNEIAKAAGVARLAFGKLDLAVDLGLDPDESDPEELVFLPYRARLCLASRAAGLPSPIDSVYSAIRDDAGLLLYARRARKHGYGGVLLIHPGQIAPVAAAFAPTPDEMEWAARVVAAAEEASGGVVSIDGRMVDAPVVARARRILAESPVASQ